VKSSCGRCTRRRRPGALETHWATGASQERENREGETLHRRWKAPAVNNGLVYGKRRQGASACGGDAELAQVGKEEGVQGLRRVFIGQGGEEGPTAGFMAMGRRRPHSKGMEAG
jgi:hypothetical protein